MSGIKASGYSQQISAQSLVGAWDQTNVTGTQPTIIFEDSARVSFSYKGHIGKTRSYYYILDATQSPALLTVDYSASHKKHRNQYLIQMVDKNTLKLQELLRKDSKDHFAEGKDSHFVTLTRRIFL